jgi:phage RecT family recombinase
MSDATDSTAPAPRPQTPLQRVAALLDTPEARIKLAQALDGLGVSPERFTRTALAALAASPYVVERCSAGSIVAAILRAATLRLELDPALGQAYIVPRKDQATLQIGARGWIDLAHRTGKLLAIDVGAIHENDAVEYVRGTSPRLEIRPPITKPRGQPVAYYCAAQWQGGASTVEVMRMEEILHIRDTFSEEFQRRGAKSVWGQHFDQMAAKTVVSRARKTWPVAISVDGLGDGEEVGDARIVGFAPTPTAIAHNPETGEVVDDAAQPVPAPAPQRGQSRRLAALVSSNHSRQ